MSFFGTQCIVHFTGEKRLIRGVTGDVICVPLVEITLNSSLCSGNFLCGRVSTLPEGVAVLVGNDLCCDELVADVSVVTRSMTVAQAAKKCAVDPAKCCRCTDRAKNCY